MQLQPAQIEWNERVATEARKRGFSVFVQQRTNQRQHDPSLILTRGPRIVLVWLRTGRRKPLPQVDVHRAAGREAHAWWPADWPFVVSTLLLTPPADGAPRGLAA